MAINLISISKNYLNNSLLSKASVFLDEQNDDIKHSINAILIALYTEIISSSKSKEDLKKIYEIVTTSHFNNLEYINLNDVFSGKNSMLIDESNNFLNLLFKEKHNLLALLISDSFKIHKESASALLKMVTPVVIGSINKVLDKEKLNCHGFYSLLNQQKKYLNNINTSESFINKLSNVFDLPFLQNFKPKKNTKHKSKLSNLKFRNIAVVIVGVLVLGSAYYTTLKAFDKSKNENQKKVRKSKEIIKNTINDYNSFYNPSKQVLGKYIKGYEFLGCFIEKELKDKTKLIILSNGGEAKLIDFIEKGNLSVSDNFWIPFRRITHNKGTHLVNEKSNNQINNLIAILKAYPEVHIIIGGYSYNQTDPIKNFEASYKFVEQVTKKILESNIDEGRITFEGYGNNYQLKEGPLPVKRISIRVTKKQISS